jgi:hypothetical protein
MNPHESWVGRFTVLRKPDKDPLLWAVTDSSGTVLFSSRTKRESMNYAKEMTQNELDAKHF